MGEKHGLSYWIDFVTLAAVMALVLDWIKVSMYGRFIPSNVITDWVLPVVLGIGIARIVMNYDAVMDMMVNAAAADAEEPEGTDDASGADAADGTEPNGGSADESGDVGERQ